LINLFIARSALDFVWDVFCAYWRKTKLGSAGRSSIKNVNFL